jgi:hypothetical protein
MSERVFQPRGADRRRQPRGGRRPTDIDGYAPLVFVIDPRPTGRDTCEAILAKLRFAVAPFESVEQAARVVAALRPDLILAAADHLEAVRGAMAPQAKQQPIPIVAIPDHDVEAVALIETVRTALRLAPARTH